jgi:hypothetical protein
MLRAGNPEIVPASKRTGFAGACWPTKFVVNRRAKQPEEIRILCNRFSQLALKIIFSAGPFDFCARWSL